MGEKEELLGERGLHRMEKYGCAFGVDGRHEEALGPFSKVANIFESPTGILFFSPWQAP